MRKNLLALSIATMIGGIGAANASVIPTNGAGVATSLTPGAAPLATTLQLATGGIGHALITPYFTVQGGNATVISLVNTDATNGKAVKVRFRGGANSDDILDFQVYMSPNDVWNGLVSKNAATGIAEFTTSDNTCTLPAFTKGVAQPFITGRLPSYATATELANHTAEGYVEIFNMADIPADTSTTSTLYSSILHSSGVPRNCAAAAVLNTLNDVTDETTAVARGFRAPTTGLFGNWTIINVAQTTTFSGSMTAIRAVNGAGLDGYGTYVLSPQSAAAATNVPLHTADPLFLSSAAPGTGGGFATMTNAMVGGGQVATPAIAAAFYDLPDMSTPYTIGTVAPTTTSPLAQAALLTGALAVTSISNEYSTDAAVNASTDWNFSMPTRRYSVAMAYGTSAAASVRSFSNVNNAANNWFYTANTSLSGDRICVTAAGQRFHDREEGAKTAGAVFSPGSVTTFRFCGETSVTTFGSAASVLGATLAVQSTGTSAFTSGWGVINTPNTGGAPGLPIMGSAFIKLTNPSASAGVSGTYGITSDHRFVK